MLGSDIFAILCDRAFITNYALLKAWSWLIISSHSQGLNSYQDKSISYLHIFFLTQKVPFFKSELRATNCEPAVLLLAQNFANGAFQTCASLF